MNSNAREKQLADKESTIRSIVCVCRSGLGLNFSPWRHAQSQFQCQISVAETTSFCISTTAMGALPSSDLMERSCCWKTPISSRKQGPVQHLLISLPSCTGAAAPANPFTQLEGLLVPQSVPTPIQPPQQSAPINPMDLFGSGPAQPAAPAYSLGGAAPGLYGAPLYSMPAQPGPAASLLGSISQPQMPVQV